MILSVLYSPCVGDENEKEKLFTPLNLRYSVMIFSIEALFYLVRFTRRLKMILVTGATGMTGSELVRRLSAKGVPVRALVRSTAKAAKLSTLPNVEIVEGDMARP